MLGDLQGHVLLRLGGRGAEMRGRDDIVAAEQRVLDGRLFDKDIDCRAGDMTAVERDGEVVLDDEAAAGTIDKANAALHLRNRAGIDQVFRRLRQRRVQGDEVGAGKQLFETHLLDAEIYGTLGRQEWVVSDYFHPQPQRPLGYDRPDIAAADEAERLAG